MGTKSIVVSLCAVLVLIFGVVVRSGSAPIVPIEPPIPICERLATIPGPASLSTADLPPIPELAEGGRFIQNDQALLVLGKALFWDMQVGSDGNACASCHFHAGGDSRARNQLSPGINAGDSIFNLVRSGAAGGPNYSLRRADFPFHVKANINDRSSAPSNVLFDTNDVSSSQGVFRRLFKDVVPGEIIDQCREVADDVFNLKGVNTRRVEPRNSPTVINAALNHRNFWDGRANMIFNGIDPFGRRSNQAFPTRGVWESFVNEKAPRQVQIEISNSSLASQAVGPGLSSFEMSCAANKTFVSLRDEAEKRFLEEQTGRTWSHIGAKLIKARALQYQAVHPTDSVLATRRDLSGLGLNATYGELVQKAFQERWWAAPSVAEPYPQQGRNFKQIEANFSLFFGLAVQRYERLLISDQTRYDAYRDGNKCSITTQERAGLAIFVDKGKCVNCHNSAVFTAASTIRLINEEREKGLVERMIMGDQARGPALYDNGFYNIGVRPTAEDIGVGGTDPFGNPLSFAEQYIKKLLGGNPPDRFEVDPCTFETRWTTDDFPAALATNNLNYLYCNSTPVGWTVEPLQPTTKEQSAEIQNIRIAVKGAFKVPGLRNIELTGPYFHNGGQATLQQVVQFYNRGGDFGDVNQAQLDADIHFLGLTATEQANLVAFLKTLTDQRVRDERAPFDHPALVIPNGFGGAISSPALCKPIPSISAFESCVRIPAVGAAGRTAQGLTTIKPFDQLLPP
jgi:cytochrome c peroxidase